MSGAGDDTGRSGECDRIISLALDPSLQPRRGSDADLERQSAIIEFVEFGRLSLLGGAPGPYRLRLGLVDDRPTLTVAPAAPEKAAVVPLPTQSLTAALRDYRIVCEDYLSSVRDAPPSRIAEFDRERRDAHLRGAQVLANGVAGQVDLPIETARRLFTVISLLGR